MTIRSKTPTVFLVDDDASVLRATERLVRSAGFTVAAFQSPEEFLEQQNPDAPGCLVLDMTMPRLNGFELQQSLAAAGNRLPIIFLSGTGDVPTGVRAMKDGAMDFLSKPCPDEQLIKAIKHALEKDEQARKQTTEREADAALFAKLTPREHEVMLGVVAGKQNKLIAAELGIAEQTIKVHRARVMDKLQVENLADLIRLSERAGFGN